MQSVVDTTTAAITIVCVGIAFGFSMLLLVLPRSRVMRMWTLSLWLTAASVAMTTVSQSRDSNWLIVVVEGVAFGSGVLLLKGFALHARVPLATWKPALVMGTCFALALMYMRVLDKPAVTIATYGAATVILNGWIAWVLLGHTPSSLRLSFRVAGAIFCLQALMGVPSLFVWAAAEDNTAALASLASTNLQMMEMAIAIALAMAQCFSMMLLLVEQLLVELRIRATNDGLTGLMNRASVLEHGIQQLGQAGAQGLQASLMLIDLDHFKRINDRWGHLCGDEVLKRFARTAEQTMQGRPHLLGRYGGEEFVVMLPDCGKADAIALAKRLVAAAHADHVVTDAGSIRYTISIGVSTSTTQSRGTLNELLALADHALYAAKACGRDQALHAGDTPPRMPLPASRDRERVSLAAD